MNDTAEPTTREGVEHIGASGVANSSAVSLQPWADINDLRTDPVIGVQEPLTIRRYDLEPWSS